jgi:type II secretory pathway component PulC
MPKADRKISSKTSPFKRGDVVIAINNQIVTQSILWHTITVSDTYSVTVVRSGKKVSFTVSPQLIVNP